MNNDTTLREKTIFVLEKSQEEFKKLKDSFKNASDAFDAGRDQDGLELIRDSIIPQVSSFYEFCFTMVNAFDDVMDEVLLARFKEKFNCLDAIMKTLSKETESGNFTEIGDILRFDFTDLFNEFSALFPEVIKSFKESTRDDLNDK